jgi:hypothetical protein
LGKGILRVESLKLVSASLIADAFIYPIFARMVSAGWNPAPPINSLDADDAAARKASPGSAESLTEAGRRRGGILAPAEPIPRSGNLH